MKIKTITCHHVYNYGASLQAYALQHYLETLGHEVEIIDFNPWFHCDRYNPFWISRNAVGKAASVIKLLPFLKYVWCPLNAYRHGMFKTWGRKATFDAFEKEYYNLTYVKYFSSEELKKNPPHADVYVAGSDQIWNTYSNNGKEPGYYLDFGDDKVKRISYAASLATNEIADGWSDFVKERVEQFEAVSVRENTGLKILESVGIKDICVVLDPVFLLQKEEWCLLASKGNLYGLHPNDYLLVYDFLGNDSNLIMFVKNYAAFHGLKIVSVNDFAEREYADFNINTAGPLEFLNLIRNAACVVASSFHATAFSVIFEKEFYTFGLVGHNNSSRMQDFLSNIGLLNRMNPKKESDEMIVYQDIAVNLANRKNDSYDFIRRSLDFLRK